MENKEELMHIILNNCCYLTQGNAEFDVDNLVSVILQEIHKAIREEIKKKAFHISSHNDDVVRLTDCLAVIDKLFE